MEDETHRRLNEALPSKAVVITGLEEVPMAGDKFMVISDERQARQIAEARKDRTKVQNNAGKVATLEEMFSKLGEHKELNLVVKADVQGSLEAVKNSISKIKVEDIVINVVRAGVGAITETDIILAQASKAIVVGFNVRPTGQVRQSAEASGVEIRLYNIIYKLLEDIDAALKGMLDPEFEEVVTGFAEVRQTFKVSKVGTIAGCYVTEGVIERNSLVRILRSGVVVFEGKMATLRRFKDDVKEVKAGYECGITIASFNDIKEGDVIEASVEREVKRK
jgi:translation initiation factor IF-2